MASAEILKENLLPNVFAGKATLVKVGEKYFAVSEVRVPEGEADAEDALAGYDVSVREETLAFETNEEGVPYTWAHVAGRPRNGYCTSEVIAELEKLYSAASN